jgi:hypothetical protein
LITFTCPSCKATCSVGDEFAGRKMKCPKCRTRIRHHRDGKIELLTVGEVPPPGAPSAPPAASEPAKKGSTVEIPVVPEMVKKLVSQSESKQNTIVIGGVIGFFAIVLSVIGMFIGQMILTVAPLAVGLATAFVWLMIRARQRQVHSGQAPHSKDAKPAAKDEGKTEALPKA